MHCTELLQQPLFLHRGRRMGVTSLRLQVFWCSPLLPRLRWFSWYSERKKARKQATQGDLYLNISAHRKAKGRQVQPGEMSGRLECVAARLVVEGHAGSVAQSDDDIPSFFWG